MYCTRQNMSSSISQICGDSETHGSQTRGDSKTHPSHSMRLHSMSQIRTSASHFRRFQLPPNLFSDPVDDDSSDTESFDADDMYGSDSDAEIIGKESPLCDLPSSDPSSSVSDASVWSLLLCSIAHAHTQARLLIFLRESV